MLNGKTTIVLLIVELIRKALHKWVNFFQNQFLGANVKVELDLFDYATRADLKMQQILIHLKKNLFS